VNRFVTTNLLATWRGFHHKMHSYAQGKVGDFALKPTPDGYVWEIPAGPMTIRYTAVIKDGAWQADHARQGAGPLL
jgi:hypothetical protein